MEMGKLSFSFEDVNEFLKSDKVDRSSEKSKFAIVEFCKTPAAFFTVMGDFEKYVKFPDFYFDNNVVKYNDFKKAFEEGQIVIAELSGRKIWQFLTVINDEECQKTLMKNMIEAEKQLLEMQKFLFYIVEILKNSKKYEKEVVKEARRMGYYYQITNRQVLHYRQYVAFMKFSYERNKN